jgi:hypothetical protein
MAKSSHYQYTDSTTQTIVSLGILHQLVACEHDRGKFADFLSIDIFNDNICDVGR